LKLAISKFEHDPQTCSSKIDVSGVSATLNALYTSLRENNLSET